MKKSIMLLFVVFLLAGCSQNDKSVSEDVTKVISDAEVELSSDAEINADEQVLDFDMPAFRGGDDYYIKFYTDESGNINYKESYVEIFYKYN